MSADIQYLFIHQVKPLFVLSYREMLQIKAGIYVKAGKWRHYYAAYGIR